MTPRVFLCEPSALNPAQRSISDLWRGRLFQFGFDVDFLRPQAHQRNPWAALIPCIDSADGVLVLGLGRVVVSDAAGVPRGAHLSVPDTTWTTPWLHVETGLALGAGVPVLVVPESGVREGIFAADTWTGPLRGTPAEEPDANVVQEWAADVAARAMQKLSAVSLGS